MRNCMSEDKARHRPNCPGYNQDYIGYRHPCDCGHERPTRERRQVLRAQAERLGKVLAWARKHARVVGPKR
jgi:hypothetical protein